MLNADQLRDFFEIGFVVQPCVFAAAEIQEIRAAFQRLEQTAYKLRETQIFRGSQFVLHRSMDKQGVERVRIDRIVWCGAVEPILSEFGKNPRLLEMASQILGSDRMNQLINQAHFKLPGDGVEFPWHQDSTHRRYGGSQWHDVNGRGSFVQMVAAVDDVTEENGPLQFIPGSCKLGHVEPPGGGLPTNLVDSATAVTATMPAGAVLLFGPYVFHRSLPNRSSRPRRVFINGFAYPGANFRVYPGKGAGRLLRYGVSRQ